MGFNTNCTTIPVLVSRGDLLTSNELNHTSIVNGARASGTAIHTFCHNDVCCLEETLKEAMGPTGQGCAEYCGVDTADIDIMMGTFTKSFGGMGGYVAASIDVIAFLRRRCSGSLHRNSLSALVCQQVITSFKVVIGEDDTNIGKQKIQALRDNSNYFRMQLEEMGLHVLGHYDSPLMPVMLYNLTKIAAVSCQCFKRRLVVVVVGFPVVPILTSRARFCI